MYMYFSMNAISYPVGLLLLNFPVKQRIPARPREDMEREMSLIQRNSSSHTDYADSKDTLA